MLLLRIVTRMHSMVLQEVVSNEPGCKRPIENFFRNTSLPQTSDGNFTSFFFWKEFLPYTIKLDALELVLCGTD